MAFDLIIFDMDGTLVDSEPIANRVFHEKLVRLGLDPRFDEATVAAYRRRIAAGSRPAAVALAPVPGPGDVLYLLDGHHKIRAYEQERAVPRLIVIAPQRPRPLRRDEFTALLAEPGRFHRLLGAGDVDWDGSPG